MKKEQAGTEGGTMCLKLDALIEQEMMQELAIPAEMKECRVEEDVPVEKELVKAL